MPHGDKVWGEEYGNLSSLPAGVESWWLPEDDFPLREAEVVREWRPPLWAKAAAAGKSVFRPAA